MSLIESSPPPAAAWRALYPFESHSLAIGGHRYHYVDEGRGEPLLFVHGNPTWSFHWRELIQAWRPARRAIAPDHLGCGLSDKPRDWPYRLADHIDNLVALVRELDLRDVTLLAHDWGGAIGLGAALAEPERFRRFVLFNTGAYRPWFIPWRIRACRTPILGKLGLQGLNLFGRAALRMTMSRRRLAPAERAGYLAPYSNWSNRLAIYRFVQDIPLAPGHPSDAKLAEIEAGLPTLADRPFQFVWGMRDWCFTPACLDKFLEIFPAASVHRVADAGHWVVEDAREEIVPVVERFFERNPIG
jgi:haloalkane dehalogenase